MQPAYLKMFLMSVVFSSICFVSVSSDIWGRIDRNSKKALNARDLIADALGKIENRILTSQHAFQRLDVSYIKFINFQNM
jgi:hypothetical protein